MPDQINLFNDIFDGRNKLLSATLRFDDVDIVAACYDDIDDGSQKLLMQSEDAQSYNIVLVVGIGR